MNNNQKLVVAIVGMFQPLLDTLYAMLTERRLDTAVGAQLDVLGKLVGEDRDGLDDATYRRYIRARVATNKSDGLIKDLIKITRLLLDDPDAYIRVDNAGHASIIINIEDVVTARTLAAIVQEFMLEAVGGGIRVYTRHWPQAGASSFALAGYGAVDSEGLGLGWTGDATLGGALIGAVE